METVDRLNALKTPAPVVTVRAAANRVPAQPIGVPPVRQEPEREKIVLEERMHGTVFMLPFLIAVIGIGFGVFISNLPGMGLNCWSVGGWVGRLRSDDRTCKAGCAFRD